MNERRFRRFQPTMGVTLAVGFFLPLPVGVDGRVAYAGEKDQKESMADRFVKQVDRMPKDQQPPNWGDVKKWMARKAPAVGEDAPDFTLKVFEGEDEITCSKFHEGRPLVLMFGSYT